VAKKSSISGFLELLPNERAVENLILSKIRDAYDVFGFMEIENRGVEPITALLSKGETSKEVYLLNRLQDAYEDSGLGVGKVDLAAKLESNKQLGLHFDLTVPFARYVIENAGYLQFPFRRSSIGKVWRGERPQAGRFREFTQADVDIVSRVEPGQSVDQVLGIHNDIDIISAVGYALHSLEDLGFPKCVIHINNRKLLQGAYEFFGISDYAQTLRIVDKLDKIGEEEVKNQLVELGVSENNADRCLRLANICTDSPSELKNNEFLNLIVSSNNVAKEGFDELLLALENINTAVGNKFGVNLIADLRITRGLDYYTGLVFETFMVGFEKYGSISSGGRYDNLASTFPGNKTQYPGVGMSIGITRLFSIGLEEGFFDNLIETQSSADVMVVVNSEPTRPFSDEACTILRQNGIRSFVSPNSAKFGKQIDFAFKRGIKYVLFIDENEDYQIKDIQEGEQQSVPDLQKWCSEFVRSSAKSFNSAKRD
jgi:histidyl-tRNA synthetase